MVKARIVAVDLAEKRIKVSLRTSAADVAAAAAAAAAGAGAKGAGNDGATLLIGDVVEVEVTGKDEAGVQVKACDNGAVGYIPAAHLADYEALCSQLMEAIPVAASGKRDKSGAGAFKMQALVVEQERSRSRYLMSTKGSLLAAAKEDEMPSSLQELRPQQFVQGYVKNVADFGCFVGFLNGVTVLAPKSSLADTFVAAPSDFYSVGQSVRCCVVSVDAKAGRAIVTLKPSVCMCPDASLLHSLAASEELLVRARTAGAQGDDAPVEPSTCVGSVVKALAEETKSYGMLFAMDDGWTGFCPTELLAQDAKQGTKCKVAVLGVDRVRDLMTLSMDAKTISALEAFKGKPSALAKAVAKVQIADSVKAVVQAVGEERVALTLPDFGGVVAVASAIDFNLRGQHSTARFKVGKEVKAVVVDKVGGTVLLGCGWEPAPSKSKSKGGEDKSDTSSRKAAMVEIFKDIGGGIESEAEAPPGATVKAVVTGLLPTLLAVRLGPTVAGQVALTDVVNAGELSKLKKSPLLEFKKGQVLDARVIGSAKCSKGGKGKGSSDRVLRLSIRPEDLALKKGAVPAARPTLDSLSEGEVVGGIVEEVRRDCLWVSLSAAVKGRVYMLDASPDLSVVQNLSSNFKVGQGVLARVLKIDQENSRLDLSLRLAPGAVAGAATPAKKKAKLTAGSAKTAPGSDLALGSVVPVKIIKAVAGMAYVVQLSSSLIGRVHMCDVADTAVPAPLALYKTGALVSAYIESLDADNIFLSLRPSRTGLSAPASSHAGKKGKKGEKATAPTAGDEAGGFPQVLGIAELAAGQLVSGYVKSTNAAGCFVHLGRTVTGRVLISELSDGFIKDVKDAFPPGKLITGRILDVDTAKGQVNLSLKKSVVLAKKRMLFADVAVGQIVRGTVKSVQVRG